ncbi:MAG: hypothetical protein WKF91_02735 [Segetibacter sp.]
MPANEIILNQKLVQNTGW